MSSVKVDHVIKEALELSDTERALIVERLLASLHESPSLEVEKAWHDEIEKRLKQIQSGEVECVPREEVRDRL